MIKTLEKIVNFDDLPELLKVTEAASCLRCSPDALYAAIGRHELDDVVLRIGRLIRLSKARLMQRCASVKDDANR